MEVTTLPAGAEIADAFPLPHPSLRDPSPLQRDGKHTSGGP